MTDPTPTPTPAQPTGTIDMTKTVASLEASFVTWGDNFAFAELITVPYVGPILGLPLINLFTKWAINWVVKTLADSLILQGFFLNTALRKASQAQDYQTAFDAKEALPPTATDAQYESAEQAEMLAFRNFVMVTN